MKKKNKEMKRNLEVMVPTDQGHVEQFLLLEDLDKPSAEIG